MSTSFDLRSVNYPMAFETQRELHALDLENTHTEDEAPRLQKIIRATRNIYELALVRATIFPTSDVETELTYLRRERSGIDW